MVVLGILLFNIASASEPVPASKAVSKSVADLIKAEMRFPEFARVSDFECCVLIRVNIMENGRFEVDCANCRNDQLKNYVVKTVNGIVSDEHAHYAGQSVALNVRFRVLDS